ncbi:hypothetical protein FBZ85_10226 [Azospirillum brasilense]|uniref:hypothetical protein n=1 Tax=Azospirillum baldaniorum TaxID=1064539 RepID=UPI0005A27B38|nr:hypothetical protein [Azospirillum baldaniorum]TWA81652.1 hypothetical protein FBZ85_10226 [Azospirillum brasilense]
MKIRKLLGLGIALILVNEAKAEDRPFLAGWGTVIFGMPLEEAVQKLGSSAKFTTEGHHEIVYDLTINGVPFRAFITSRLRNKRVDTIRLRDMLVGPGTSETECDTGSRVILSSLEKKYGNKVIAKSGEGGGWRSRSYSYVFENAYISHQRGFAPTMPACILDVVYQTLDALNEENKEGSF